MKIKETAIRALTLGTGLAIGIVLIAKACFEMSYDGFYRDIDRIYQIMTLYSQHGDEKEYGRVSGAIAPGFRQYVPGIETATRMTSVFESDRYITEDKEVITGSLAAADTSVFDVFNRRIISGNPKEILAKPLSAMVSSSFADKLGGPEKAIGAVIASEELQSLGCTIEGIFEDFPDNGTFRYDILLSMATINSRSTENWIGNDRYRAFVKLAEGVDPASLGESIRLMQEKNQPIEMIEKQGNALRYFLKPFNKMHTSDPSVRSTVIILSITALLLIAVSLLNYILIVISAIIKRTKEMGVRKCLGATEKDIYAILLRETAIDLALSLVLASALIAGCRPLIADLTGIPPESLLTQEAGIILSAIIIAVFAIAAGVPGYLYSRIPAGISIRNFSGHKRRWKLALLFMQFTITVFMTCTLLILGDQYRKVLSHDYGYEMENILWFNTKGLDSDAVVRITEALNSLPEVQDVQMACDLPMDYHSGNNVILPETGEELFNVADQYDATEGFFKFFGIPFIEGRAPASPYEVAVSESFAEKIMDFVQWTDGVTGHSVIITEHSGGNAAENAFTICGVYRNYVVGTLGRADKRPSIQFTAKPGQGYMPNVLVKTASLCQETTEAVRAAIDAAGTGRAIEVHSYRETLERSYDDNRKMKNTILAGCIFSIAIVLFGLIGYVRDESERRSKEMAIRKIHGAETRTVIMLFIGSILKIAAAAAIAGNIAAWFAADNAMQFLSEKTALSPLHFIGADIIVLTFIVLATVLNCLRISRRNPADSLKNE